MLQHVVSLIALNGLLDLDTNLRVDIYYVLFCTLGPSITGRLKQRGINQFQVQRTRS